MGRFRDAITGLFTTKAHAEASPDTTVRETIRRPGRLGRAIGLSEVIGADNAAATLARDAADHLVALAREGKLRSGESSSAMDVRSLHCGVDLTVTVMVSAPESWG